MWRSRVGNYKLTDQSRRWWLIWERLRGSSYRSEWWETWQRRRSRREWFQTTRKRTFETNRLEVADESKFRLEQVCVTWKWFLQPEEAVRRFHAWTGWRWGHKQWPCKPWRLQRWAKSPSAFPALTREPWQRLWSESNHKSAPQSCRPSSQSCEQRWWGKWRQRPQVERRIWTRPGIWIIQQQHDQKTVPSLRSLSNGTNEPSNSAGSLVSDNRKRIADSMSQRFVSVQDEHPARGEANTAIGRDDATAEQEGNARPTGL